jgi:hypothetical protein
MIDAKIHDEDVRSAVIRGHLEKRLVIEGGRITMSCLACCYCSAVKQDCQYISAQAEVLQSSSSEILKRASTVILKYLGV